MARTGKGGACERQGGTRKARTAPGADRHARPSAGLATAAVLRLRGSATGRLASRSLASVWSAAAGPKSTAADLAGLGWSSPRRRARRRRRKERNLDVQAVDHRHASCECAETRGVSAQEVWSSGQICHAASGGRRAGRAASRARTGPPGSAGDPGWNSTRTWQALPSSCPASSWSAAGRLPAKPSTCGPSIEIFAENLRNSHHPILKVTRF